MLRKIIITIATLLMVLISAALMSNKSEVKKSDDCSYMAPCIETAPKKTADVFLRKQRKEPKVMYA